MQSKRGSRHSKPIQVDSSDDEMDPKIMSQVSYEAIAEQEAKLERKQLQEREAQKKQLASLLREQQQQTLGKKQLSGKERLDFLLKQTEFFTSFLIQQRSSTATKDPEMRKLQQQILDGRDKTQAKRKSKHHADDSDEAQVLAMTRLEVQPSILKGGELRSYQLTSVNWLIGLYESGINGILADEMGLGKTIQTIAFLAFLKEFKKVNNYFLIIVPKTVISNWKLEFKKWLPCCRVLNLIATKTEREDILKNQLQPGKFDVCLTTFEGVRLCMSALLKFKWQYLIVDEAHKLKNEESQISQRLRQLNSRNRLLLTGTPLQNNLHELWSLLNFLLPEVFSSSADFDEWFSLGGKADEDMSDRDKESKNKNVIEQLHRILRPFLLRRIKREVEKQLKPKVEIHVSVGITELQKQIYRSLLKQSKIEKGNSVTYYKNILIQLRKVCDHPYLFHNMEPDDAPELGDHIIKASGKMLFLDALCKKAKADGNQMLVFSGFTTMLDILEDFCNFRELKYCRLDGNTSLDDREQQIEEFVKPGSDINLFLISTRAGGLGLNLMTANIVVLYDSDWNPQMDLQAMDRAHRIGQTKIVQVFRLVTPNTMEEKMIERQSLKLKLDNLIIQKGRTAPKSQGLGKEEMQDMVNYGADAIFQVGDNLNDKDIDTLIREGENKARALSTKAQEISKEKMNMLDFQMNNMNLYNFEDVDYAKQRREDENIKLNELVRQMITEDVTNRGGRRVKTQKNLSEANLCPKIFQGRNIGASEETKRKKVQMVQDFRFFPNPDRLRQLIEKEIDAKYSGYFQGVEQVEYTEEDQIEKDALIQRGFSNWDRRDFQKFLSSIELFRREDTAAIAHHIGTKTEAEVKQYQDVFYANLDLLNDAQRIKKVILKSGELHSFKNQAPMLIKSKVMSVDRPVDDMVLNPIQKSKYFSREADIVLLLLTDQLGYGQWTVIKHQIRRDPRVRFDHLLMSRSEVELQRRVDILVKTIEKEGEQVRMPDVEMQSEQEEVEIDEELRIRVGQRADSEMTESKAEIVVDDFEGLEEAALKGLKKQRLN